MSEQTTTKRAIGRAAVAPPDRSRYKRSGGIAAYLLVMVSLQIFLLVVAVEGVLAHQPGLARRRRVVGGPVAHRHDASTVDAP